jgi:hypothetical protein
MRSHFSLDRGLLSACAVAGATTLLNGSCSAQTFVAADYATNSTYATGWSAGQNGGYGFGPWSMNYTSTNLVQSALNKTSPYNPFGIAWALYNPVAPAVGSPNPPDTGGGPPTGDISRAGRAIPNGLQIGQTLTTVIANPAERKFYRGYTIVFANGGDNIQYGYAGSLLEIGTFEYFSYGQWYQSGKNGENHGYTGTTLYDTDTTSSGMQIDLTVTSTNTYHLAMTPLANPSNAFTYDGAFKDTTNGPINWVTFQLYNTDSDFYPGVCANPQRTDFYIQSMTIKGLSLAVQKAGSNLVLSWPTNVPGFNLESTTNLVSPAWVPVLPVPAVVNDQNVVTNTIMGPQKFYRLHY